MLGFRTCIYAWSVESRQCHCRGLHQQRCNDNVHGLTVADFSVGPAISCQDPPQTTDAVFTLEARVFWQASIQVFLNLIDGQRVLTRVFGQRFGVELGVLKP